ncbi:kinase-like protein [Basidiobolus meristosporus CBS 931.73]|uniref:non-specific serine/threonine protein kinase n=1 Tax=Basidiobolus meristosporus CBS 931.73 TaxID=1314790 RepID=A0A1Y1YFF0_9FUNG|nr:kinase-like protein [Basidiobolus meristosporus CBS 931.73]|eukprot:ORX96707.1 kinase-like protein [Basidiobolus meristosporus CBS 931.73]
MPATKPLMIPYLGADKARVGANSPNKGISIPYHSEESLVSHYSTKFDSCSIKSGFTSIASTAPSTPTNTSNAAHDSFTIGMSSLYKVPSRFIFRDAKKDRKSFTSKHFSFLSNMLKKPSKPCEQTLPKRQTRYYAPLLDALRKRAAPSLNQLYGEFTDSISCGPGGGVRETLCPRTGHKYAVKSFRKMKEGESEKRYYEWISNEVYIAASLVHENVIQTVDVIMEDNQIHEVMEYCPQDLFNVINDNDLTPQQINTYFSQLMHGLAYLHHRGVAHRDLKLENLCVDQKGTLKIIDFGCAFIFLDPLSEENRAKACELTGSDPYIAPEIFSRKPYDAAKADIWSAAIIYLCMVLKKFPWDVAKDTENNYKLYQQYRDNEDFFIHLPKESFPLIRKMLDPNPDTRITVNEVFEDSWFQSITV